jgi:hypothetical protein
VQSLDWREIGLGQSAVCRSPQTAWHGCPQNLRLGRGMLAGSRPEQTEEIISQSVDMWRGQLRTLLFEVPGAADDLRDVVQQSLVPLAGSGSRNTRDIKQSATVKGGISIQAGHDADVNLS